MLCSCELWSFTLVQSKIFVNIKKNKRVVRFKIKNSSKSHFFKFKSSIANTQIRVLLSLGIQSIVEMFLFAKNSICDYKFLLKFED